MISKKIINISRKNEKVIAAQSFKKVQMTARPPQAERGVWGRSPPQMRN
jgi:hypothetical protein